MIYEKIAKIQSELKVPKNLYNSFGKYKYRNLESICEAVKPLLTKYGCLLTLTDSIVEVGEKNYIQATATIADVEDATQITVTAYAREADEKKGMDASQVTGTASSYARKYALNGLFLIDDTKDADTDEYKNENEQKTAQNAKNQQKTAISAEGLKKIKAEAKSRNVSEEYIAKLYKVKSLADMTEAQAKNLEANWNKVVVMYGDFSTQEEINE